MSTFTGRRVGILPEVLADLTGPLGDQVRAELPESIIIAQLGGSVWKIQAQTWGVSREAMPGIVPDPWLGWGLGAEGDRASRAPEADILAAHDAVTTNSRKAQHKLGNLVNQGSDMLLTQPCWIICGRQHALRDRVSRWGGAKPRPLPRLVI